MFKLLIFYALLISANNNSWLEEAQEIATLRTAVEKEQQALNSARREQSQEKLLWQQEINQLQITISREETNNAMLLQETKRLQEANEQALRQQSDEKKQISALLEQIRTDLNDRLCLRQEEEIKQLDNISRQLQSGKITAGEAAYLLSAFINKQEQAAVRISGGQQQITINGQSYLADYAAFGFALLYFQTADHYGLLWPTANGCQQRLLTTAAEQTAVKTIIDAVKKGKTAALKELVLP